MAAAQALQSLVVGRRINSVRRPRPPTPPPTRTWHVNVRFLVRAVSGEGPRERERAPPGVDTRIHWDNEDEGWVGGSSSTSTSTSGQAHDDQKNLLGEKFADLLNQSTDSHYQ